MGYFSLTPKSYTGSAAVATWHGRRARLVVEPVRGAEPWRPAAAGRRTADHPAIARSARYVAAARARARHAPARARAVARDQARADAALDVAACTRRRASDRARRRHRAVDRPARRVARDLARHAA